LDAYQYSAPKTNCAQPSQSLFEYFPYLGKVLSIFYGEVFIDPGIIAEYFGWFEESCTCWLKSSRLVLIAHAQVHLPAIA
jgi:hypothetical protein